MSKNNFHKHLKPFLLCLLFVLIYYFFLTKINSFQALKLKSDDLLYKIKLNTNNPPGEISNILIIAIDSLSLKNLEQKFPVKRDIYASLLDTISEKDPKTILFDIAFPNRDEADFESDVLFSLSLKKSKNVILPTFFNLTKQYIPPHGLFLSNAHSIGHLNKKRDPDGSIRRTHPIIFYHGSDMMDIKRSHSIEIEALQHYWNCNPNDLTFLSGKYISLKKESKEAINIPLTKDDSMLINFSAETLQFSIIPLAKIIKGIVPKYIFYNKIILIGVLEEIFHDIYPTPIGPLPGIIINANSILTVLSNNFINPVPESIYFIVLFLISVLSTILVLRLTVIKGLLISITEIAIIIGIAAYLFIKQNILWSFFDMAFSITLIFSITSIYKYIMLKIENIYFRKLAITDGLTGLYIHRYLMIRLNDEFERALRYNHTLSFIITDIDHFKSFNDTYGHEIGNEVLKMFARVMQENFRKADILARYGGEEFCVVLPLIDAKGAFDSAERFRKTLEKTPIPNLPGVKVTVSIGITSVPEMKNITSVEELIKFADKALYESKEGGRNRSTIYSG